MPRRGTETAILVQAAEYEVQHTFAWESVRVTEEVESSETPVDAAEAEVFCEVVFEFVSALLRVLVSAVDYLGGMEMMHTVSRFWT